jgi:membrane-bound serine protease (ClpP class)
VKYNFAGALFAALALTLALSIAAAKEPSPGTSAPAHPTEANTMKSAPEIDVLTIDGAISPISAQVIVHAIDHAERDQREALIIRIDTPGGLDTSMREIIKRILVSRVPVVVYVAPSGSRAASAGTFIAMAAHVAAMSPGTSIGAATPVNLGGGTETTRSPTSAPSPRSGAGTPTGARRRCARAARSRRPTRSG